MTHALIGTIDIGANKSLFGSAMRHEGQWSVMHTHEQSTEELQGALDLMRIINEQVCEAQIRAGRRFDLLSISTAGVLDLERGMILHADRLGLHNVPLRQLVKDAFGVPTVIGKDGDMAILGEARFGVGRGTSNFMRLTVGSGIGFGLIQNGHLIQGVEIGCLQVTDRSYIPCSRCGKHNCLRMIAPGNAIEGAVVHFIEQKQPSTLRRQFDLGIPLKVPLIGSAAARGDALARSLINASTRAIGEAIHQLQRAYHIEMCVIGGGVANLGPMFIDPIRAYVPQVRITESDLNGHAGLYGAIENATTHHPDLLLADQTRLTHVPEIFQPAFAGSAVG